MQTSYHPSTTYQAIEDYAVIGDLYTVALVGKNGSIDWCCLPAFDSPSVFGALLDAQKGGFFSIAPTSIADTPCKQLYMPESNILITRFLAIEGVGEITDFMPIKQVGSEEHQHLLIRSVKVVRGTLTFEMVCRPAFNYARDPHTIHMTQNGAVFHSENLSLGLASSVPLEQDGHDGVRAVFTIQENQSVHFFLQSAREDNPLPDPFTESHYHELAQQTLRYWRNWLSRCHYQGRWRETVQRSALILKLLTYAPTGAIVSAPTTSLPKAIGGTRNWDYRYTWVRDASYTIYSLLVLGLTQEAEAFMEWLDARCHEMEPRRMLQPVYSIRGDRELPEITLDHLEGYRQSRPVRIGNAASTQLQLDIYGELMDAVYLFNRYTPISYDLWQNLRLLLEWLEDHWQDPDAGMWERRDTARPYVHSRLMSWVAFDRALRLARYGGLPAPISEWTETSATVYEQIMAQGWSERRRSFVQYYGSDTIDASALFMVLVRFAGPTDPRILQTIDRIQEELTNDSLVYRYSPLKAGEGGASGAEGTFNSCSFWLAESLTRAGRINEGRLMLEKMLTYSNHVGMYAEEIGATGEALGNYPHAFTHLSLIAACTRIDQVLNTMKVED